MKDASTRLAYLALTDPADRPLQNPLHHRISHTRCNGIDTFRYYDAVGPETMSFLQMLKIFAAAQGNHNFRPVFIDYRNMERVLNIQSLGNLNRQFVSLLRSEQDASHPIVGDPTAWEQIIDTKMMRLEDAFPGMNSSNCHPRRFPYLSTALWVWRNPKVIMPGISLSLEIIQSFLTNKQPSVVKNGK